MSSNTTNPQAPFHHFPSTLESGSDIPDSFGYITLHNTSQLPQRAFSALQDSHPTFVRGSVSRNDTLEIPKSASSSPKVPVYFNPLGGKVGLVCGRENQIKYSILKNLLAASWKDREPHSRRDILCFTAENGSLEITQTVAGLLPKGESGEGDEKELEIIVLTWPSNLSNLRALHASSKNVKVHPLLVHPEDVKLEHLRHIYEGRVWGTQNAVFDDILQGSRARGALVDLEEITLANLREKLNSNIAPWLRASIGGQVYPGAFFFLDLNPHLSQQLDDARSDSRANPPWMEWILQGQPRSSGSPTLLQGDHSHKGPPPPPLLLCVDWTGCTPEEHRVQNVLADIVLRQWVGHAHGQPQQQQERGKVLDRGIVVCDNVHHYLTSEDPNPFIRTLSRLSHESIPSSPDSKVITPSPIIPSFPAAGPPLTSHNNFNLLNLLLLTESPIAIPASLQDISNFLILHRFTSPGWLAALEGHFHLHTPPPSHSHSHSNSNSNSTSTGTKSLTLTSTKTTSSVDISSSPQSLLDQILDLDDKHVLLFAPPKPVFAPGTQQSSTNMRGSGYGSGHSYAIRDAPVIPTSTTTNGNFNINGVIQRPKKQSSSSSSSSPTPVPVGRHLTKICLSKEDHLHPEIAERNGSGVPVDVGVSGGGEPEGAATNFGVIGGNTRRIGSGNDNNTGHIQPAPGASSLSPFHGGGGANGFSRPPRSLLPQGGVGGVGGGGGGGCLTPSPSSSILRDRSPHVMAHHQLPGSHSPAAHHWPTREENPNHSAANGGFPFASPPSSNPFISPSTTAVNGYHHIHQQQQQRSPPTSPFIPINPSDAVISRPIGIGIGIGGGGGGSSGGGMGMGMGGPRRISPPSSSSASGMSFSFSHSGNAITPSSSAANPSSISTSFGGMSPTSPVGPGFSGRGGTAFSPFATPSMLKTADQGDFGPIGGLGVGLPVGNAYGFSEGLAAARNAYSISEKEMASRYLAERTPQVVTSFGGGGGGGTRRSPQPSSSERHSRTDTTSTTGSRDDTSSAGYVEVSPGSSDFSRVVVGGPVKDERPTSAVQKMESGPSRRSYAGVAAPAREGLTSSSRRDTVLPPPGKEATGPAPGSLRPPLTTSSQHSTTPPSSTDLQSPSSPSSEPPPPPPIYAESFFWPLLDALEKSRAQVSTPHNRAQSVRHSVVGQELPPSARARLGLTFKEYVAAAARQGVVVTGDSGDKAWIAMREWKYPGKSYSGWPAAAAGAGAGVATNR